MDEMKEQEAPPKVAGEKEHPEEKKAMENLDREKAKLEEKVKSLSKIIELMATKKESKQPDGIPPEGAAETLKSNFESLKKAIVSLEGKIKKSEGKARPSEDMKNLLASVQKKIAALDSVPPLLDSMKKIEEELKKMNSKPEANANIFGGFGETPSTSKEASLFYTELKNAFEEFRESTELKMEDMEKRLNILAVKMDTKTLKNLESLASSKDEILNTLIPARVREEVDKILSALAYSLNNITQEVNRFTAEAEKMNNRLSLSMDLIERLGKNVERLENRLNK
jgi:predicted  nucleic acid-binding Zn-ribbon protein